MADEAGEVKKPNRRPPVDWESVEREYRAGIKSLKQIGSEHGVSDAAIIKRARRDSWERDLSAKIRAKAEAIIERDAVPESPERRAAEREVVEANAQMQAQVRREHRRDVRRARELVLSLLGELESATANLDLFEQLGEMLRAPDEKGADKVNDLYRKVISMASRIDGAKKLAEAMKVLIGLEREAFGIAGAEGGEDGDDDFVRRLLAARARADGR